MLPIRLLQTFLPRAATRDHARETLSRSERAIALHCWRVDGWYNFDVDRRFGLRR